MKDRFSLEGKVVVVTGGYGRFGRPVIGALLEHGAQVICACRNTLQAKERLAEVIPATEQLDFLTVDVGDPASIETAYEQALNRYSTVDVLVNAAGCSTNLSVEQLDASSWDDVMSVNVRGTFLCSRTFAQKMKENRHGSIVNVASVYGLVAPDPRIYGTTGRNSSVVYGASKAAVLQMTRYLAVHWAPYNIRVNSVSPGGIFNNQEPDFLDRYASRTPLGRMACPEDLQGVVVFLASDASGYITGQNIIVDGGWTVW